eukprot:g13632.t1
MALETKAVSVDLESSVSEASTTDSPIKASEKLQRKGSFRRGGVIPTAICLSKAAIGAGVLSVSGHAAEVGVVWQVACLLFGGLLTVMSIRMLCREMISVASIETKKWGFEDVSEELFHPVMSLFTGFMNVCNCLGAAAGYLIVCGQVFVVVFQANRSARDLFVVLVGIFVCCPMALARHVGFMRHLALLSIVALIFVVVVVAWYWGDQGTDESVTVENFLLGAGGATPIIYMNAINNMIFAFCNQFNVPQLTGELTPEPSRQGMTKVAVLSTSASFFLYASVSIVGVLAFGVGGNQKDSLILDLMPVHVLISLLAVMFSVLTCFQFHIYPIRQFLAYVVRKARGRSSDDEEKEAWAQDVVYFGLSLTRWYDIVCALGTVCLVVLIAVVITSLRTIMDFIGAFASAYISFINLQQEDGRGSTGPVGRPGDCCERGLKASEAKMQSTKFQRQSSFRRGGVIPTAICLSKATISVGVLSMSVHAAEVGALYQLACLMLGGVLTVLKLFHPVMAIVTGFMNACVCLGSAAGYLIVCGQVFVVVFPTDDATRNLFVVSVGIFVCCPMALARHVGFTRHLAAMTVGALILLVIVVAWYMGEHRIDESVTTESFLLGPGEATFVAYMNSINNMIFAYNNQFNVPQLTRELTHEPSRDGMTKVAILSTSVTFLLYALVFLLSVLAFGVAENQKDSLILDLMPVREDRARRVQSLESAKGTAGVG